MIEILDFSLIFYGPTFCTIKLFRTLQAVSAKRLKNLPKISTPIRKSPMICLIAVEQIHGLYVRALVFITVSDFLQKELIVQNPAG
jgi:hypothetical protein